MNHTRDEQRGELQRMRRPAAGVAALIMGAMIGIGLSTDAIEPRPPGSASEVLATVGPVSARVGELSCIGIIVLIKRRRRFP
jgi:hypothetical protein